MALELKPSDRSVSMPLYMLRVLLVLFGETYVGQMAVAAGTSSWSDGDRTLMVLDPFAIGRGRGLDLGARAVVRLSTFLLASS